MEQVIQSQNSGIPPARPKNWLVESILVTIFCCLPFGIAGIVFASQVNSRFDLGDYQGAEKASKDARKWTLVAFIVGGGWIILFIIFAIISSLFFGGISSWHSGGLF